MAKLIHNREFKQEEFNEGHAACLALHLSAEDYGELIATGALSIGADFEGIEVALNKAATYSQKCYAIVNKSTGLVYAIGGYTAEGVIWFLSSRYLKNFTKECKREFKGMLRDNLLHTLTLFDKPLWNYAWYHSKTHLKLISSMGARMSGPVTTEKGVKFVKFEFYQEDFKEVE
ncbi:MAG: phage protein Gp13 family protein [Cetobacterium sp.]|uniref:phage protein Gp13 family protein n=1 Tax=Cetobacterium sp. TaxID=2071632 RepID=UPI003EE60136